MSCLHYFLDATTYRAVTSTGNATGAHVRFNTDRSSLDKPSKDQIPNEEDGGADEHADVPEQDEELDRWTALSRCMTCCFMPWFLVKLGKADEATQQAWREKV
jgi:hypothetical protein